MHWIGGQRSRSHGYKNRHRRMAAVAVVLLAWDCAHHMTAQVFSWLIEEATCACIKCVDFVGKNAGSWSGKRGGIAQQTESSATSETCWERKNGGVAWQTESTATSEKSWHDAVDIITSSSCTVHTAVFQPTTQLFTSGNFSSSCPIHINNKSSPKSFGKSASLPPRWRMHSATACDNFSLYNA